MNFYHELPQQNNIVAALLNWFTANVRPKNDADAITILPAGRELAIIERYVQAAGLVIDHTKYFRSCPGFRTQVHTDAEGRDCGLNIPVIVPVRSGLMRWYDNDFKAVIDHRNNHTYLKMAFHTEGFASTPAEISAAAKLSKAYTKDIPPAEVLLLTKPTVVRVDKWHDVNNEGNPADRVVYSIRFKENPSFEELVERFSRIRENTL
jgi:hypothetical protein